MKCPNCGTELTEGMKFCINCGTPVSGISNVVVGGSEATDGGQVAQKPKKKTGRNIVLFLILGAVLYLVFSSILGSPKKVAMDFSKAMLSDFNAKKMVSLMSEGLLYQSMELTGSATEKILISEFEEILKSIEQSYIYELGENWKMKLEYIDEYRTEDGNLEVVINAKCKGTGEFFEYFNEDTVQCRKHHRPVIC